MYSKEATKLFLATRVARPASAGVIVENHVGEALVLKAHYKPYWSFPGGWIEHGQTPRKAAIRELWEETGLELEETDMAFAFTVARQSDIMQTFQFMFRAIHPIAADTPLQLQAEEIATAKFVTKQYVQQHEDEFGGAVQAWAAATGNESPGYYEQQL
ncbi:MAG: NUDIX domain-containing protein [Candidatus Saccharimonadales bacterium]